MRPPALTWVPGACLLCIACSEAPADGLLEPPTLAVTPLWSGPITSYLGCDTPSAEVEITHDQSRPIEVSILWPEGWHGPSSVLVESDGTRVKGYGRQGDIGERHGDIVLSASGAETVSVPIELEILPRAWERTWNLGPLALTLAIGVGWAGGPGYPGFQELEPLIEEYLADVATSACFRHALVFHAEDSRARWMTDEDGTESPWVDLDDPSAEDRLKDRIQRAFQDAEPGVFPVHWAEAGRPPQPWPAVRMTDYELPMVYSLLIIPGADDVPCCVPRTRPPTTPVSRSVSPTRAGCTLSDGTPVPPMATSGPGGETSICAPWFFPTEFVDVPKTLDFQCPELDPSESVELLFDGRVIPAQLERTGTQCTLKYREPWCTRTASVQMKLSAMRTCE